MKELTIEQKAQRYDEALQRTRKWYDINTNEGYRGIFEDIFPELAESKDERIELLNYLYDVHDDDEERARWIAWLEKQKDMEAKLIISDEGYNKAFQDGIEEVLTNPHKYGLEKQGKNNMGISEATKQELEDNLNKALEKETPESWNEFLEKQGEQKNVDLALYNDLKPWEKPEYIINAINRKRVEPFLKGDALHKFKNEFNSLKQILHLLYDYGNSNHYRLALHWASWGAQNLKDCFGMSENEKNKMDDVIGEQKPADKVEPKFHEGEWITIM